MNDRGGGKSRRLSTFPGCRSAIPESTGGTGRSTAASLIRDVNVRNQQL